MPYEGVQFAAARQQVSLRLADPTQTFWTDEEVGMYLVEALRVFSALTGYWRDTGLVGLTPDSPWFNLMGLQNGAGDNLFPPNTRIVSDLLLPMEAQLLEPIYWGGPSPPAAPVIPGTAISSGILDNFAAQPWLSTHDAGTPGTSTGTSTYISPAVGRNFTFTYTANAGQRYSLYFADDTTSQNFCFDLYVAFDDPSQILNVEMDMNQVMADGRTVIFDCQCAHVSQAWEYNAWTASTIYGDPQTWGVGVYHHVRIFWHRDVTGNATTWDGVEFDGVYHPFNVPPADTAQSLGWAIGRLVCNFQIEGSSSVSGAVSAYGRNMTVWRW